MVDFVVHSPARVCLYGDHQDYLGLPVIAATINRFLHLSVSKIEAHHIDFQLLDLDASLRIPFDPSNVYETKDSIDFFRAGLRVAARHGYDVKHGLNVSITSDIPINAGVSSSSALMVGWLYALTLAFGDGQPAPPDLLARMAFEAEVLEHRSPGGQMDQYTIAHGGLVFIETGSDIRVHSLPIPKLCMILIESGINKETLSTIGSVKDITTKAFDHIRMKHPGFELNLASGDDLKSVITATTKELRPFAQAAIRNHLITQKAHEHLRSDQPDQKKLGQLMSEHHGVLSQSLEVSHPSIDHWMKLGRSNGAFGGKIVGSGHGGCSILLVPDQDQKGLCETLVAQGAKAAYPVSIDQACHHTQI